MPHWIGHIEDRTGRISHHPCNRIPLERKWCTVSLYDRNPMAFKKTGAKSAVFLKQEGKEEPKPNYLP